jgi:hypothetical protein
MIHALTEANRALLLQAIDVLDQLDDEAYRSVRHRLGGHVRHILEFYECFLDGVGTQHVDYDARRRDREVETGRAAAKEKAVELLRRLESSTAQGDKLVWVRMEDASGDVDDAWMLSSVSRELQSVRSHTVHHFALIAANLCELGVRLGSDFGVAPSTLRFRASLGEGQPCAR